MHGAQALVVALSPKLHISLSDIQPYDADLSEQTVLPYSPDITEKLSSLLHFPLGFQAIYENIKELSLSAKIRIQDKDFFNASGEKLGIGSSAAITVALISAQIQALRSLHQIQFTPDNVIHAAIQTHRAIQNNMGSGADVIASALGGALLVHSCPDTPIIQHIPANLIPPFALLVTHQQAPTCHYIKAAMRMDSTEQYWQIIRQITDLCQLAAKALTNQNKADFLDIMATFPRMLQTLGSCIQMPVLPPIFHELVPIAQKYHVILKTSGAGGGDIFIAFSEYQENIDQFISHIPEAYHVSRLQADIAPERPFP